MADTIVVIAAGEMGSGIGKQLSSRGARVLTSLQGRGAGSAARAKAANMTAVDDDAALVAQADVILSVVPPGQAVALAERLKPAIAATRARPIYVDLNAIAPATAATIGATISSVCRYIDGGIVGPPPGVGAGPTLYVSGDYANDAKILGNYGLKVRTVDGGIGAASALKMSYAGITKGTQALWCAMILGATRAGCADALWQEMSESQPQVLDSLSRLLPRMFPKAYRWVAEMDEIAEFLAEDQPAHDVYAAFAKLYDRVASGADKSSAKAADEIAALTRFCELGANKLGKVG